MNDDVKTQTAYRPRVHLVRWIVASAVLLLAAFVIWQKVAPKPRTRAAAPQIVTVAQATPGDLIRLGMGVPHGIFNKSDQTVKVLFWVSPSRKLYDLFWGIHNMKEQKPEDVVAMAAEYNIHFLPPPPGA